MWLWTPCWHCFLLLWKSLGTLGQGTKLAFTPIWCAGVLCVRIHSAGSKEPVLGSTHETKQLFFRRLNSHHTCVLRRVINTTPLWYTLMAVHALSSYGTWAPEHAGSVAGVRAQLPHCCEILVPQPGIKPECPALEGGFLTTGAPGSSHSCRFLDSTKLPKGLLCDPVILGYSHLSFQEAPTMTCAPIPR